MVPQVFDAWPKRVVVGAGSASTVGEELRALGRTRALVVTDGGVRAVPAFAGLLASLRATLPLVEVYDRVPGNPSDADVDDLVAVMRRVQPDALVAVGGGSPMDAAKCANLVFTHGGRPLDYAQGGPRAASGSAGRLLPLIAVPTTAGTASEVTSVSVIVDAERGRKVSISGPRLVPDVSVLDAEMTVSLPPHLTAYTGMDACTHLVEAYVSSVGFPPADGVALAGLGLIGRALPAAVARPDDLEAREQMLLIAMMGGVAFNHNRLGLVHAMAHQLSTVCGLHHGLANALLLPRVMGFNLPAAPEKFAQVAHALGVGDDASSPEAAGVAGIAFVNRLERAIGIPGTLARGGGVGRRHPRHGRTRPGRQRAAQESSAR